MSFTRLKSPDFCNGLLAFKSAFSVHPKLFLQLIKNRLFINLIFNKSIKNHPFSKSQF